MTRLGGGAAVAIAIAIAAANAPSAYADEAALRVGLAPMSTLTGKPSRETRAIERLVAGALAGVPGVELVRAREVERAIRKSRRPELRTCDGEAACLAEIGALLGCRYIVFGEVGGLARASVLYLKVVDAQRRTELRSTSLELSGQADADQQTARAAAVQLLAPRSYTGRLRVEADTAGASIYVDGRRVAISPAEPIELPVGAHALRVTHPEFRDFVRFVDVTFDGETRVTANLQQFPVVSSDFEQTAGGDRRDAGFGGRARTPWYRRWYAVAGLGAAVLVGAAVLAGVLSDGVDAEQVRVVGQPRALGAWSVRW